MEELKRIIEELENKSEEADKLGTEMDDHQTQGIAMGLDEAIIKIKEWIKSKEIKENGKINN